MTKGTVPLGGRTLVGGTVALALLRCSLVIGDLPEPSAGHSGTSTGASGLGAGAHAGVSSTAGVVPPRGGSGAAMSPGGTGDAGEGASENAGAAAVGASGGADGVGGARGAGGTRGVGTGGASVVTSGGTHGLGGSPTSAGAGGGIDAGSGGAPDASGGHAALAGRGGAGGTDQGARGGSADHGTGGSVAGNSGAAAGTGGSSAGAGGSAAGAGGSAGKLECDADQDGALSKSAACRGDDCDDADSSAHPGQASYFTTASAAVGFDYDCNGQSEPEFQTIDCSQQPVVGCGGEGFSGTAPDCGQEGAWIECAPAVAPLPLLCVPVDKGTRRQACR